MKIELKLAKSAPIEFAQSLAISWGNATLAPEVFKVETSAGAMKSGKHKYNPSIDEMEAR
jgi:hypothetical protein